MLIKKRRCIPHFFPLNCEYFEDENQIFGQTRLISAERGFRGSNFDRFILGRIIWPMANKVVDYVPLTIAYYNGGRNLNVLIMVIYFTVNFIGPFYC